MTKSILEQIARDMKQGTFPEKSKDTMLEDAAARIEALEAALREFVEAYKHQDCDNYADEMARAYSIADAALHTCPRV